MAAGDEGRPAAAPGIAVRRFPKHDERATHGTMNADAIQELRAYCNSALACADLMRVNGSQIRREIRAFGLEESQVEEVAEVCELLLEARWDLGSEVRELEELDAPADCEAVRSRVERIHRWLGEGLPRLHALVQRLEAASEVCDRSGHAFVLVAESATHILQSFLDASEALERYRAAADPIADA